MSRFPIAIIGGTGVGQFDLDTPPEPRTITTRYGEAMAQTGVLRGKPIVFLARHGAGHKVPPHQINYRANIAALVSLGVRAVLATTAVGGLRLELKPGEFVLLNDLIDFTRDRTHKTFFDGDGGQVVHTDFTQPYSEPLFTASTNCSSGKPTSWQNWGVMPFSRQHRLCSSHCVVLAPTSAMTVPAMRPPPRCAFSHSGEQMSSA